MRSFEELASAGNELSRDHGGKYDVKARDLIFETVAIISHEGEGERTRRVFDALLRFYDAGLENGYLMCSRDQKKKQERQRKLAGEKRKILRSSPKVPQIVE